MRTRLVTSLLPCLAALACAEVAVAQEVLPGSPEASASPSPTPAPPTKVPGEEPPAGDGAVPEAQAGPHDLAVVTFEQQDLPKRVVTPASDGWLPRFGRETARVTAVPVDEDFLVFSLHGEYQMRLRAQTDLPLEAPARGALAPRPGFETRDPGLLGQNVYLWHWLRLNGRIAFRDDIIAYGQIDLPRGLVAGQTTQFVDLARDPMNDYNWYDIHPRELYVEFRSPIGNFRVGQQTSHWGQGILANDGNTPTFFGDNIRGALVERLLFATTPMGKGTPLFVAVAGDLVFEDNTADVFGNSPDQPAGDLAGQAVAAIGWREDWAEIGVYGVYRHQRRELLSGLAPYDESIDVGVVDVAGKVRGKVPGTDAYAYAEGEAAAVFGRTTYARNTVANLPEPIGDVPDESVLSFGASATFGFVHMRTNEEERWGDVVTELEWGYASGDPDPIDGEQNRFTFDTNHNVGLILFDQVLGWKTARAATIAADGRIVGRAAPGLQLLPSQGGVFGATYLNPRVMLRPIKQVDVKLGFLWAQATADVVDPYQVGALGTYANFDGGDPTSRDLGVEIDTGVDVRIPVLENVALELGVEGGVFLPGRAFDDEFGRPYPEQLFSNTKLGLQF
jgi:hypothetical protein